jgi:acid phosphatase
MRGVTCNILALLVLLTIALSYAAKDDTLRMAFVITRHGDRTPIHLFANNPNHWTEGLGQLTGEGMRQHYLLGQKFRHKYVDQLNFVSGTFNISEVYARATGKDRTLMSAQSFMLGMFPPGTGPNASTVKESALPHSIQPVPIHAATPSHDILLHAYKNCPRLSELKDEVKNSAEWKQKEEENKEFLKQLASVFGEKKISLSKVSAVYHVVNSEEIHHQKQIPDLTQEMKAKIAKIKDWVLAQKFKTREMGRMGAGNLLNDIINKMRHVEEQGHAHGVHRTEKEQKSKTLPKFTLFSGHDGTILALLSAMGLKNYKIPEFASFIEIQLHETPSGEFTVSLNYDDENLIPECKNSCSLRDFEQLMAEGISHNWDEECKAKNTEGVNTKANTKTIVSTNSAQTENHSLVLTGAGFALGFIAAYALMLLAGKKEHNKKE